MLDNMAISALPVGWYDKSKVKNQDPNLTCGKMFAVENTERSTIAPVQFTVVPNTTPALRMIDQIADANIDIATSMPSMNHAPTEPGIHRTSSGLSILGGWSDAPTRGVQKNIDSGVTYPLIRALYFWNMQLCEDDSIKGDFDVEALGVESVMSDEIMTQRVIDSMEKMAQNPEAMEAIDSPRVWKFVFEKMGYKDEGFIKSPSEIKKAREEKSALQVQTADQIAAAQAKYQPAMTDKDAALKMFSEIPDDALNVKIAALRLVSEKLGIQSQELDTAMDQLLHSSTHAMAATPTVADKMHMEAINAAAKRGPEVPGDGAPGPGGIPGPPAPELPPGPGPSGPPMAPLPGPM